jgi:hypothetical protein
MDPTLPPIHDESLAAGEMMEKDVITDLSCRAT